MTVIGFPSTFLDALWILLSLEFHFLYWALGAIISFREFFSVPEMYLYIGLAIVYSLSLCIIYR